MKPDRDLTIPRQTSGSSIVVSVIIRTWRIIAGAAIRNGCLAPMIG